ncbi:hypothetical protein Brsp01_42360 [Brucella sp. NBRC 12950]|nr:hypothetical protein Brsp01_42360 [Brucella sp. NBRC 12950]
MASGHKISNPIVRSLRIHFASRALEQENATGVSNMTLAEKTPTFGNAVSGIHLDKGGDGISV